mgnify:CR=1 FL=1
MNSRIVVEQLVQTKSRGAVDDGPADVAALDGVEGVAFGVVVGGARGRRFAGLHAVGAAGVHVVARGLVDGGVELVELVGREAVGGGDGVAGPGCDEVGLGAAGDQRWTGPVASDEVGRLQHV